jgi:hypothetical protein
MKAVTQDNISAIEDAEKFWKDSIYNDLICGKHVFGGVRQGTVLSKIDLLLEKNIIDAEDKEFYINNFNTHNTPLCSMPMGHSGRCKSSSQNFFGEWGYTKIADCHTAPGADDVLIKNRAKRSFPIQFTKVKETALRQEHDLKSAGKLKAGIFVENANTPFLAATADIDMASMLVAIKGSEDYYDMPQDIEQAYRNHFKFLIDDYASRGISISNDGEYLCDMILGYEMQSDWVNGGDRKAATQIQFGHVVPISPDKYMTRGGNVIPLTRNGNLMQGDGTFEETKETIKIAYMHMHGASC